MSNSSNHIADTTVAYLLDGSHSTEAARQVARTQDIAEVFWLSQRDSRLGWIGERHRPTTPTMASARTAWQAAQPIILPSFAVGQIHAQQHHIAEAHALMESILDGVDYEQLLLQEPYVSRLAPRFDLLASTYDEGDPQGIVKIEFDAIEGGTTVAENLWIKLAWLSYAEQDGSLRFRFSFGMENYEDVAADPQRQKYAAQLSEAIFPESAIISDHPALAAYLRELLQVTGIEYVERIIYFNAPEGGAQFHHDVERGHLGVVFAQISGRTAWLALPMQQLVTEIQDFLTQTNTEAALRTVIRHPKSRAKLLALADDRDALTDYLNRRDNDPLEQLINRSPAFVRHLIERGHAHILHPGDILLLPQHDMARCAWHAVYCLDDHPGEALSFAVRQA